MTSPTLNQASDALWVSNDPNSRQLAEMREMSERAHRHTMAATRDGREEGRIEGRELGFAEGLRIQIRSLAKLLDIELSPEKQEHLAAMGSEELQQLADKLIRDRKWP